MPKNFLGTVHCSDSFGKPKNLEAQIVALGSFYDIGVRARDFIAEQLKQKGLYTFRTAYSAGYQLGNDKIHYTEEEDPITKAHEVHHKTFHATQYENEDLYSGAAYTLYKIMNESLALAYEQSALVESGKQPDYVIDNSLNNFFDWGKWCYELCMNVTAVDRPEVFEDKVMKFISKSFCVHEDYNWLALVMETQYFGLFGPCFDLVYGYQNDEELWKYAYEMLAFDHTGKEFLDFMNSVSEEKRGMVGPLFEKTVQKSLYEFRNETDKFQLMFIAPKEKDVHAELSYLRDIQDSLDEQFGKELASIGQPGSRIWANHLKIRR